MYSNFKEKRLILHMLLFLLLGRLLDADMVASLSIGEAVIRILLLSILSLFLLLLELDVPLYCPLLMASILLLFFFGLCSSLEGL